MESRPKNKHAADTGLKRLCRAKHNRDRCAEQSHVLEVDGVKVEVRVQMKQVKIGKKKKKLGTRRRRLNEGLLRKERSGVDQYKEKKSNTANGTCPAVSCTEPNEREVEK